MRKRLVEWIKGHFFHNGRIDVLPLLCVILAIFYMTLVACVVAIYAA